MKKTCSRLQVPSDSSQILTARDLCNTRKSFHSLDFNKQVARKNTLSRKEVGLGDERRIKKLSDLLLPKNNSVDKIYPFASYSKRSFLSEGKSLKRSLSPESGSEYFKIPEEKYKNWHLQQPVKFEKMTSKYVSRYDAPDEPWRMRLSYGVKEELMKKKVPGLKMGLVTSREINEVHSKYPIRLAV